MKSLGLSSLKSLENFRSLAGSLAGSARAPAVSNPRGSSDSTSYGSFVNLKLTAEKLVKDQASVKTDLELAQTKLRKASDQIHVLETKLQQSLNENAKLKVKQKEDTKLWGGLDSKLSSTNTICDQLTETLQHLADQTCAAEETKGFFEGKLENTSKALDEFDKILNDLSAKLESANTKIVTGKQEILELKHEKEEVEKCFQDHRDATKNAMLEKDVGIKELHGIIEDKVANLKSLEAQLEEMVNELNSKEDTCRCLRTTITNLEKEKSSLQSANIDFAQTIEKSSQDLAELRELLNGLVTMIAKLHTESASLTNQISMLFSSIGVYCDLVNKKEKLTCERAQYKFDKLHEEFKKCRSENDTVKFNNQEQKDQILELQKAQEFSIVQHADECRLAEANIRDLETKIKDLLSNKSSSEKLTKELMEKIKDLSQSNAISEAKGKNLSENISRLEAQNRDLLDQLQLVAEDGAKESEALKNEISKHNHTITSLKSDLSQLHKVLDEKEQLLTSFMEREKQLEEQKAEVQESLVSAEIKLSEAKKQYDLMLEGKKLELSKHLKDLSLKNDQAISDIRKNCEMEKLDVAMAEKEKADKIIKETERRCNEKITENKEESQQCLMRVKEEHAAMVSQMEKNFEEKESKLLLQQREDLKRVQLQAENELRERISSLRKEHEFQIKAMMLQHEDESKKLQEELELQKSREEKQRTLLQLQWKVMSENQQVDQEANSKKEFSVSSIKLMEPSVRKEHKHALTSPESRRKDLSLSGVMRTPMSSIMKKVEKPSRNIPKHRRKVTRHEYEIETSNGTTVTKRRKTKSTVMFGEPNSQRLFHPQPLNAVHDTTKIKEVSGGNHPNATNIGDLFSEGSLNPYADDPYAFD
ncbi:synaptonemal complex protein ZEP1-like [Zingiber officinale]|uniref:synaptonemal complex protein ZEP1-like n=1 Tax=Zingiber officinale TaxID=94328 RepID=UPI001C4BD85C|nr:synaptonemal complex protein ZEP1-like [Zingiber officinale]XP_042448449.1 synaptonemal complex protein ZEP1-like [Zingiber officinale]